VATLIPACTNRVGSPHFACDITVSRRSALFDGAGMNHRITCLLLSTAIVTPLLGAQARPLFNGTDLAGWHADVPVRDTTPTTASPFSVRDGMIVVAGEPRGHLITDTTFRNYRLDVEYRFTGAPGNAGVLVHASTPRALYAMFPKSIEVQMESGNAGDFWCIVEDITVPDMVRRRGPRTEWGITEGKGRRIRHLLDGREHPVGEWNRIVVEATGRSVTVWVNGTMVNRGTNATADRGQIALQSEGAPLEIRKVVLTPLRARR
jgi:Domain of Unknown Function (DUF1080)